VSTVVERLRRAVYVESATIAPQTSPLIEAAKEAALEIEERDKEIKRLQEQTNNAIAKRYDLEAEIERLRAYQNQTALAWTKLTESQEAEIEQLKGEVGRLDKQNAAFSDTICERDNEIERLQRILDELHRSLWVATT
jgi:predicted  nucleic acid-binding Zn-ribbon protein